MTTLYLSPIGAMIQQLNNLGVPLSGGLVNIYVGGSVNTPVATYTDATGTTQNANPITLNSAGRLANGAGVVSVWVPANTPHQLYLTDSAGNQLYRVDNLLGINDPTALIALLQSTTGIDSIANAVRSYDIVSSLRAATPPVLASGATLIVLLQGGATVADGFGGAFYWSATSSATDDGVNVVKPVTTTGAGRFLRVPWNASNVLDSALALQSVGYLAMPQVIANADTAIALIHQSKQVYHSSATPHTYTIPANGSVAFPIGTVIDLVNDNGGGNLTIAITTDTLRWAPVGSTGSRTLAANGSATIKKITATSWQISGVNLS